MTKETATRVASTLPSEARKRAENGVAQFEKLPMPDPREEDWRYVELGIDLADAALADVPGSPMDPEGSMAPAVGDVAGRALSVDGAVLECEGDGIESLRTAGDAAWAPRGRLGVPADLDRFSAAHHAFGTDGLLIEVPKGRAITAPYYFEVQAVTPGALVLPRVIVAADDGAEVAVVIHYRSPDGVVLTVVPHVEVVAGANARVSVTIVQTWGDQTTAVAQHHHVAGRDAALGLVEAGMGGGFSRLHMRMDLDGPGSDARVLGLYFGDHTQTLDYRAFVNHNAPNTTSDMFLKGAVGDHARSVFTGLIRIEPAGQKTNAHQTNRNLVLSEGAEAHSVPNLEILANDVRCGHGSAVGPLDAEQRYYLMSRGLDRPAADRLQVKGFFEEVLSRFVHQGLVTPLRNAVMAKYAGIRERSPA